MKPRRSTPGDLAYAHIRREEIAQANADAHVRQLTRKYPDLRPEEIARFREESLELFRLDGLRYYLPEGCPMRLPRKKPSRR